MNRIKTLAVGISAIALVGALSACGESTETAKANFCDSLDEFSSTAMNYQGLDPETATNEEMDRASDDIADAWYHVENEAADWANAEDNELTEAYDDLYDAIQDLPGDNTASENLADVDDELAAIPTAYRTTFDGSGCSTSA